MGSISGRIERAGPFAHVTIMATPQHVSVLKARKLPVPQPVTVRTLVDTGAESCVLDFSVVKALCLLPTGRTFVHTMTTGNEYAEREQYDASYFLSEAGVATTQFNVSALGADLASEGFLAIIGWDILLKCVLTCDGPARTFRLDFKPGADITA